MYRKIAVLNYDKVCCTSVIFCCLQNFNTLCLTLKETTSCLFHAWIWFSFPIKCLVIRNMPLLYSCHTFLVRLVVAHQLINTVAYGELIVMGQCLDTSETDCHAAIWILQKFCSVWSWNHTNLYTWYGSNFEVVYLWLLSYPEQVKMGYTLACIAYVFKQDRYIINKLFCTSYIGCAFHSWIICLLLQYFCFFQVFI